MATFERSIEELEKCASLWWPKDLENRVAESSPLLRLSATHLNFLDILAEPLIKPTDIFESLMRSKLPANVFLKHLAVLADYGGEPIQRLGRSFQDIFAANPNGRHQMEISWEGQNFVYEFESLPISGLGNSKLAIDGPGLVGSVCLTPLLKDMIMILMFAGLSSSAEQAGLESCDIGVFAGNRSEIETFVRQRYLYVSKITSGATSNSLGQVAQSELLEFLRKLLPSEIELSSNASILLDGYSKKGGMPFDIVAKSDIGHIGIEISFQVTTNSTIERKAGQAPARQVLMHDNGYYIAYVIDGAGNFQRRAAIGTICDHSDCTIAYAEAEFEHLAKFISSKLT